MIFGVGIDMVEIRRIEEALERFGRRFAERVLTRSEWEEYERYPRPAEFIARRFAAKEALVKAAGTGFRQGLFPREITIHHNSLGRPELRFSPRAREALDRLGVAGGHLSISDERDYALACVMLERKVESEK